MSLRLGIDVGGTNTDAVILDESGNLLAKAKRPTTLDVTGGIRDVLQAVLASADGRAIDRGLIRQAMLGTTHCTNAIVERKGLSNVAILRIGAPASLAIPPLADWPEDLVEKLHAHAEIVEGGHEFDGREIVRMNEQAIIDFAHRVQGVRAVAVTSIFAPVSDAHEKRAEELLSKVLGDDVSISLSSQIGSVGLLERENATILNAALTDVAVRATTAFSDALAEADIHAEKFFAQNDGTLMRLEYALRYPILTVASGPTNSLRGAAYLTGRTDAVVIDVGGTTSDFGVLLNGFPRESSIAVEIGGVRTNFRMPDLISMGLGGGTKVIGDGSDLRVGPESVGYQLTSQSLIFGGDVLTMSDVAVRAELVIFGDPLKVANVSESTYTSALKRAHDMLADGVDRMKTSARGVPVIAVGGGSFLIPDEVAGASEVLRPEHSDVANAIGAAIAQVSGEVDRIFSLEQQGRQAALGEAKQQAVDAAVQAGADPDRVQIIEVDEVPLAYLPGNATRIRVKAAGPLASLTVGDKAVEQGALQ